MITFKQAFVQWQRAFDEYTEPAKTDEAKERYAAVNRAWIDARARRPRRLAGSPHRRRRLRPLIWSSRLRVSEITVRPERRAGGAGRRSAALLLVMRLRPSSCATTGLDGWAATEIDRMAMLLRKAQCRGRHRHRRPVVGDRLGEGRQADRVRAWSTP